MGTWERYAVHITAREYYSVFKLKRTFKADCSEGQRSTPAAIKLKGSWNKAKRTFACVSLCVCVCAHQGLRKIIAIDLRRRNVEMLPDGTFSCEWLGMRRVIFERPGRRDAANAHQNTKCCPDLPSRRSHSSPANQEGFFFVCVDISACRLDSRCQIWGNNIT